MKLLSDLEKSIIKEIKDANSKSMEHVREIAIIASIILGSAVVLTAYSMSITYLIESERYFNAAVVTVGPPLVGVFTYLYYSAKSAIREKMKNTLKGLD